MFAHKDIAVYMKDINDEFVKKGLTIVANMFDELAKKKKLLDDEANRKKNLVKGGTDYSQLADTEVIVEAAVERMDLKKKILQECEAKTNENAIFATNTSTLSVNELATASKRPQNVVGMHFFNPVSRMPLVEIIRGKETSEKTIATIYKLALKLGKVRFDKVTNITILGSHLCQRWSWFFGESNFGYLYIGSSTIAQGRL